MQLGARRGHFISRLINFFKEVWSELKRVRWPSLEELTRSDLIVIITLIVVAVFVALWDLVISNLIGLIAPGR